MLVHYCAPAAVELGHAVRSLNERASAASSGAGGGGGWSVDTACLVSAATSLAIFASAFRALFFTSIYFHTVAEIVVAALVVLLLFYLPAVHIMRRTPSLLGPCT